MIWDAAGDKRTSQIYLKYAILVSSSSCKKSLVTTTDTNVTHQPNACLYLDPFSDLVDQYIVGHFL
jgi:hypothetical protein